MIYLLTPTGGRPAALTLLARYVAEQTYKRKLCWLVVDDCDPVTPIPKMPVHIKVVSIRPEHRWQGTSTQAANMLAGLAVVPDDAKALVLEDDDLYLPQHVENIVGKLESYELVGEATARYYNIQTARHQTMAKGHFPAMASIGVRGSGLKALRGVCGAYTTLLDVQLWRCFTGPKKLLASHNVVGIKGMPGRAGIGIGHRKSYGILDTSNVLEHWAGEEIAAGYRSLRL